MKHLNPPNPDPSPLSYSKPLLCAQAAIHKNAENVSVLDLSGISSFTDAFVICSGISDRQVQAIADSIQQTLKKLGHRTLSVEGYSEGRWVLLDFGDVIVHVFLDAVRDYYDLETFWANVPKIPIPAEFHTSAIQAQAQSALKPPAASLKLTAAGRARRKISSTLTSRNSNGVH